MALVKVGYEAYVEIVDKGGNSASFRPSAVGADFASALANVQALVADLVPLTKGLVKKYKVAEVYAEDTSLYGSAGSEIENIAEVVCPLETVGKTFTFKIPAPVDALFVGTEGSDYNKVNTANANLIAYIENFTDKTGYGTPGLDAGILISDGEKVRPDTANDKPFIDNGKRIHRASRKG